eukprot:scaffold54327_cov80-Phaeocystis_antarctica.AAC.3
MSQPSFSRSLSCDGNASQLNRLRPAPDGADGALPRPICGLSPRVGGYGLGVRTSDPDLDRATARTALVPERDKTGD